MAQVKYIIGNAKNVSAIVEKEKVPKPQLIVSSPPYFDLLNYANNKKQIGYGQKSYSEYLDTVCKVFQHCYDLSASNATFWMIVDTFKKSKEVVLFPFDIVTRLKATSKKTWILKDLIIWDKDKNHPWGGKGNFKNQHEHILLFAKNDRFKFNIDRVREVADLKKWWITYPERYHPDGKAPSNVWNYITPIRGWGHKEQDHFCPLPFPLLERIISISSNPGDWVLDPFAGSGSLLAIADKMKRNAVGIDVNRAYKKRFETEVSESATKYWEKRVDELKETEQLIKNFKKTNNKLRKLKIASNICAYLNKYNEHQFLYYAKNKPENGLEILVLQNGVTPKTDMTNEKLNDLISQANIDAKILVKDDLEFFKSLSKDRAYKYRLDKFYSYTNTCKIENITVDKDKDGMYSDIELKISNR